MKWAITPATVESLQAWYRRVNRRVYAGKLPKAVTIRFADFVKRGKPYLATISKPAIYRETYRGGKLVGRVPSSEIVIEIEKRLQWCWLLATRSLVHEIVHLAKPGLKHGRKFDREIERIAKLCYQKTQCF